MKSEFRKKHKVSPFFYAGIFPNMKAAAEQCGYALALHGSMMHDFDLIAVPWVEEASTPEELVHAIAKSIDWRVLAGDIEGRYPVMKPHGRMCWSIHLESFAYIDLSIMPMIADFEVKVPGFDDLSDEERQ